MNYSENIHLDTRLIVARTTSNLLCADLKVRQFAFWPLAIEKKSGMPGMFRILAPFRNVPMILKKVKVPE